MSELFVRSALPRFAEPALLEERHDLTRFEDGRLGQALAHVKCLSADELALQLGLAALEKHLDHFLEIRPKLVERRSLAVSTGKPRHPPDVKARINVSLDDRREILHR